MLTSYVLFITCQGSYEKSAYEDKKFISEIL
jgi:hypothetical protein